MFTLKKILHFSYEKMYSFLQCLFAGLNADVYISTFNITKWHTYSTQ